MEKVIATILRNASRTGFEVDFDLSRKTEVETRLNLVLIDEIPEIIDEREKEEKWKNNGNNKIFSINGCAPSNFAISFTEANYWRGEKQKTKKKRWNLAGIGGTIRFFRQGRGKNCDKREEERDWDVFDPLNV